MPGLLPLLTLPLVALLLAPWILPDSRIGRRRRAHTTGSPAGARTALERLAVHAWVYYTFIGLCLVSFSVITVAFASALAAGGSLARALCAFVAIFWTVRLLAATFVFDMRPYLTNGYPVLGYHAINIVFVYLPVVYALAAGRPLWFK